MCSTPSHASNCSALDFLKIYEALSIRFIVLCGDNRQSVAGLSYCVDCASTMDESILYNITINEYGAVVWRVFWMRENMKGQ